MTMTWLTYKPMAMMVGMVMVVHVAKSAEEVDPCGRYR